jgi:hypothetical protein
MLYFWIRIATNNVAIKTYVLTPNFRVHEAHSGAPEFDAGGDRYGPLYFGLRVPIRATVGRSVTYRVRLVTANPLDSNLAFRASLELPDSTVHLVAGGSKAIVLAPNGPNEWFWSVTPISDGEKAGDITLTTINLSKSTSSMHWVRMDNPFVLKVSKAGPSFWSLEGTFGQIAQWIGITCGVLGLVASVYFGIRGAGSFRRAFRL